ncbi:MAG: hypothetical protein U1D55_14300 [Phycisphaerae bacterium]
MTKLHRTIAAAVVGAGLATTGGCPLTLDPNQTVADALSQLAQTAQSIPALNQLTVGDLANGFLQFASQAGTANAGLTADQQAQIEALQQQLDSGAITAADFESQVGDIVGTGLHVGAFGGPGFHGPFGGGHGAMADALNLTDAQKQQAQDIFKKLHDDITALRDQAHQDILAVLTPEQQATLQSLKPDQMTLGMPYGRGRHGGFGPGEGLGFGPRLASALNLTADQQTKIDEIRTNLRTAIQTRHQQAHDEFRAILTSDQQAIFDQFDANHQQQEAAESAG